MSLLFLSLLMCWSVYSGCLFALNHHNSIDKLFGHKTTLFLVFILSIIPGHMDISPKLKTGLLPLCSLLHSVIRTSGEGEGRAAERAGAAPEGPGPAGAKTAGLLSD